MFDTMWRNKEEKQISEIMRLEIQQEDDYANTAIEKGN